MKKVCVFTGAASGIDTLYKDAAYQMGEMLASRGLGVVYGGGKMGLMGAVADGVLAANGKVTGIIPKFLDSVEVGHKGITDLHIIDSMHERKAMMYDAADAFIIFPGGLGTLDETMEIITWRQLGLHQKPIIIVNLTAIGTQCCLCSRILSIRALCIMAIPAILIRLTIWIVS